MSKLLDLDVLSNMTQTNKIICSCWKNLTYIVAGYLVDFQWTSHLFLLQRYCGRTSWMGNLIRKLRHVYVNSKTDVLPLLEDVLGDTVQSLVTEAESSLDVKGLYLSAILVLCTVNFI